ncbi:MAG: thiamine phosphate synthase [Alphaproteobacteria bacterium]
MSSSRVPLPDPPLLVITDRSQARAPLTEIADALFQAGLRWLMLREKDLDAAARRDLLRDLVALGAPYGATVTVNGDLAAAQAAGAAGVHLPAGGDLGSRLAEARRALGPGALLGASAHDLDEARVSTESGADYVTLSPVFESASKPGYGPALGPAGLETMVVRLALPAIALGGVVVGNAGACLKAGAAGVAVMGAVMAATDPGAAAGAFLAALAEANAAAGVASGQILR